MIGKQPRSTRELLKEISVIAKAEQQWLKDNGENPIHEHDDDDDDVAEIAAL